MPVYSRSLLLFAILAAAALVTWVLARNTEREPDSLQDYASDAPPGLHMRGVELYETDDNGQVPYRIFAESVEQESSEHDTALIDVRVEYSEASKAAWELTAARGAMTPDRELMTLQGVRLTASTEQSGRLLFETRELSLDLAARAASTRQPVQLRTDECESNARGLNVDLNRDRYELLESVTTCRPRAPAVLATALIAGAAVAQEPPAAAESADTIYRHECYPEQGDLIANVLTCTDGILTDDRTFRLTFGLGTVSGSRLTTVDREWRLTDGMRLEYETAVLVADSATFRFDDAGLLQSFELTGMPAELSDVIDGESAPIRIRATSIAFDREAGEFTVPGEVEFLDDANEANAVRGCALSYRFEEKTYVIGTPECGGFRATLAPPSAEDSSAESPDEP